jgi:hypothetical protein
MEGIDSVVKLLRHEEKLAIGAKRQRPWSRVAAGKEPDGIRYRLDSSISLKAESNDIACSARVQHVDEVSVLGHGNRLGATARNSVNERESRTLHTEYGNTATAGIHGQKERAIFGESEGSLRRQWIGGTAAAAASR